MYHHDEISFEEIDEIDIIFIVQSHIVVACDAEIHDYGGDASDHWCLDHIEIVIVCIDKS